MNKNITIVAPSGAVEPAYVDGAAEVLRSWGHQVRVAEHAKGKCDRFSGCDEERIADLQGAIDDDWTDVILCARGGYGLVRIIDKIDFTPLLKHFKLIVGFSDITAIHNALSLLGLKSLHAPMAKHIALEPDSPAIQQLKDVLDGKNASYRVPFTEREYLPQNVEGVLAGGNLSIIYALRGTPFDLNYDGKLLLIEDVGERLYHIDRMMQNLRLGGVFGRIKGLIVGQFTDTDEDTTFPGGAYGIIAKAIEGYNLPVVWDFPAGHIDNNNMPLMLGAKYRLNADTLQKTFTLDQLAD